MVVVLKVVLYCRPRGMLPATQRAQRPNRGQDKDWILQCLIVSMNFTCGKPTAINLPNLGMVGVPPRILNTDFGGWFMAFSLPHFSPLITWLTTRAECRIPKKRLKAPSATLGGTRASLGHWTAAGHHYNCHTLYNFKSMVDLKIWFLPGSLT